MISFHELGTINVIKLRGKMGISEKLNKLSIHFCNLLFDRETRFDQLRSTRVRNRVIILFQVHTQKNSIRGAELNNFYKKKTRAV